jgi:uncharacterized peroxidase-related enzyme
MSVRVNALTREEASPAAQEIFDAVKSQLGKVPNVFVAMAHSPNALKSYLEFNEHQTKGSLNPKEVEAVNLAASESNRCPYCQAAFTTIAKMKGFSDEEAVQLRAGTIDEQKLRALTRLTRAITESRGRNVDEELRDFESAGYTKENLVDVVALIAARTFTNYLYAVGDMEIDFAKVKEL